MSFANLCRPRVFAGTLLVLLSMTGPSIAAEQSFVGFGKVDITPVEPVRLSGYAARDKPHTGVADPLYARAMVLSTSRDVPAKRSSIANKSSNKRTDNSAADAEKAKTVVLVSVDSIAVVGDMTTRISEQLSTDYGLSRSDLVICSTHSHAAPHAAAGLTNLYRNPLSQEEAAAIERNTARVEQSILLAIDAAMQSRQAAKLETGEAQATFAVNRRVLVNGVWSGFGIQADGPVDRRVRLLRVSSNDGKLLGAAFMYACHCTTLGPSFNEVSGDWAGLSASELEKKYAGSVFLPVIGCGADANPEPRRSYDDAKEHAAEMVSAVETGLSGNLKPLSEFPVAHFGYAGLAPELPTRAELEALKDDKDVAKRRWAASMLATWDKMGRLPETYPAPIHTWQFGKELLWIFLGGEVVVDYQIRLEKNLSADQVWVAAYTDDVFAYVASERMRAEGGYEVDFSMVYYNQPGRWQSGTEDLIERRVQEIIKEDMPDDKPRGPNAALESIRLPEGFKVELVAAEPQLNDPVNIAFGHDGRMWVVEMVDYPLGAEGKGRVSWLRDDDGDERFEQAQVFLSNLDYPTAVLPWRDGIIVIEAPTIFFAADRDGDGRAEVREDLLQGIGAANPQHRASGFEVGLDGWVHFTSGDGTRELTSTRNGKTLNVAGRDVCWHPDSGEFFATSGHTQFVRSRDEFGNWFGNVNNQPMFHYAVEDVYRSRGGLSGAPYQHLLDPPVAPPVYPYSHTKDRFNDLFTFNRFTSACSSIICRVPGLGEDMRGAALVCEPVHNLVARFQVEADGASFRGHRFNEDAQYDWFASSDPFSRPVRIVNAPDGTLWIVDMVRQVIEHPQWIPMAWQQRLDVRAGTGLGRIYRVYREDYEPRPIPRADKASEKELVELLSGDDGARRDMAAQQLAWRATQAGGANLAAAHVTKAESKSGLQETTISAVGELARSSAAAAVRAQALGTLTAIGALREDDISCALADKDARVRRFAVQQAEHLMHTAAFDVQPLVTLANKERDPGVLLQLALTLGGSDADQAVTAMRAIATRATIDPWLAKSLSLVADVHVAAVMTGVLSSLEPQKPESSDNALAVDRRAAVESTLTNLWSRSSKLARTKVLKEHFPKSAKADMPLSDNQVMLLTAAAAAGLEGLTDDEETQQRLSAIVRGARNRLFESELDGAQRARLIPLLALNQSSPADAMADVLRLLRPQESPENQQAALNVVRRLKKSDDVPKTLIAAWPQFLPEVRTAVSSLLLERRPWAEQFIAALESGAIKVGDLDVALAGRLRSYGDRNLMARANRVLGKPPSSDRSGLVSDMLGKLSQRGDVVNGEKIFVEHCAVCHRATATKPLVGPPLENLSNWTQQQWVVAILDPNRAIEPKYQQYALLTNDGQTLAGLVEDRSSHSLTIAAADGRRHEVKLSEIDQLKSSGTSLMPEGLETKLTPSAFDDLLAFLRAISTSKSSASTN